MRVELAVIAALLSSSVMARAYGGERAKTVTVTSVVTKESSPKTKTVTITKTIPGKPQISTVTETVTVTASPSTKAAPGYPEDDEPADDDKKDGEDDDEKTEEDPTPDEPEEDKPPVKPAAASKSIMIKATLVGGKPAFDPAYIKANVGDTLDFHFQGTLTHSVARGSYDKPCEPVTDGGFYSGMQLLKEGYSMFKVKVTDSKPIWFYCTYGQHCQHGMVGVVNAPEPGLKAYSSACAKASKNVSPSKVGGGQLSAVA
ncbi:hypothetical protein ABW20_dc0108043 [Dactylellina cionopaga]|nr:hypothetical protein ABW20_dc0108043 [Dactylellina cionopaga]